MVPYPDTPLVLKSFADSGVPIGIAKPDPEPFIMACDRLGVSPRRTLMVGNNRLADSGSICIGCFCLILPPVPPGASRGLRAAADVAGIAWAGLPARASGSPAAGLPLGS
jgi:beta-phosphoglucomutase-like phosphatase (HAD superfamily)